MNFLMTPEYLINLDQIAYVHRNGDANTARIVFSAAAPHGAEANSTLNLILTGADADMLVQALTRKPAEEASVP